MAEHSPEIAQVDAKVLFERERCRCCDCCNGYCPDDDFNPDRWEPFIAFVRDGLDYLGSRHIVIRRDRLAGLPEDLEPMEIPATANFSWAVLPPVRPGPFQGRHVAKFFDRIDRAGLACHEGNAIVHLYVGDQHVGWTKYAKPDSEVGITADELPVVRAIAKAASIDLTSATSALRAVEQLSRPSGQARA